MVKATIFVLFWIAMLAAVTSAGTELLANARSFSCEAVRAKSSASSNARSQSQSEPFEYSR
jgi:hypothetical protein